MSDLCEAMARANDKVLGETFGGCALPRGDACERGNCGCHTLCHDLVDAALAAIEAAGWVLVPKDATEAMVEAGMAARKMAGRVSGAIGQTTDSSWRHEFRHEIYTWAAMLDAVAKF